MPLIPKGDEDFLAEKGFNYELVQAGTEVHLILNNWPFPISYMPRSASILVRILPGYPLTPIDMFYTVPDVRLAGNGAWPQAAEQHEAHGGRTWQRWSRHINWRSGVDTIRSFIAAITVEINKGI